MALIPPHIVDEIMHTARIEEVIGQFVHLKKSGSNLKGLSPFTDEKTPSFMVSPAKQIFKCFSTGKGGTVVTFLMEKEHFSYPEALRWLADKYNIQVPEEQEQTDEQKAAISERESLFIINDFANKHFMHNMHESEEGKAIGYSYFTERGFRPDIIEKFQLGYCLNTGKDLTEKAIKEGFNLDYLEKVGLVKSKDDHQFDFFRGRVMFPIHSVTGRVLGFGGRTLFTDKKVAKYFNSPEIPIYNKSEILYGLYYSKGDIIKYDNCYLCEGYTDVISMYQAGITNVVSSSGTSLTKEQIKLIRRYTNNVTILYDGDAAGIKASFRGIDLILEEGLNVQVVLFPEGEDPDSFSKKVSSSELETYIEKSKQDFISFKADILLKDSENDPLKRSELIRDVVESVALIPDQITRTVYAQQVARQFDIAEEVVNSALFKQIRSTSSNSNFDESPIYSPPVQHKVEQVEIATKTGDIPLPEYELLRVLVKYGTIAVKTEQLHIDDKREKVETSVTELIHHELEKDELHFTHPLMGKIYQLFVEGVSENRLFAPSYFLRLPDQEIVRFVSQLEADEIELSAQWTTKYNLVTKHEVDEIDQTVLKAIYSFKLFKIEEKIDGIRSKLAEETTQENDELIQDLLAEHILLDNVKKAISQQLGRTILR